MGLQQLLSFATPAVRRTLALGIVVLSVVVALVAGAVPTVTGGVVSAVAVAALGAAAAVFVHNRVGAGPAQQLGGRAQAARRGYLSLALATIGLVYLVLVGGVLATNADALWNCPTVLCSWDSGGLAMAHRAISAVAVVFVLLLAVRTWRTFPQRAARATTLATGALIGVQVLVGLLQLWLLRGGAEQLATARLTHLALGSASWVSLVCMATLALRSPWPAASTTEAVAKQPSKLKDYVSLTKPGVITLLIFTTFAAMFITPNGLPSFGLVFWTLLGGWLMPAGAHALNCYIDRDIDVRMGRTGRRPLPSNRIPAWHALVLGLVLAALSFVIFITFVNWAAAWLALAGFFYYVVLYTMWLKRSTMSNIVIGGGAGAFPPLVGWAAMTGGLTLPSLFLFLIIFYWTPPHFWALALIRQKDYANAGVPMLPVVAGDDETKRQIVLYSVLMLVLTLLLTPFGVLGLPYLVFAGVLGGIFLFYAVRLYQRGTTAAAWSLYKFSLLYLFLLFVAMMVDRLIA